MPQSNVTIQIKPPAPVKVSVQSLPAQQIKVQGTLVQRDSNVFQLVLNETPAGVLNGSNATFTANNDFQPESVEVFVNGLKQMPVQDFQTIGVRTIQLSQSPGTNENIIINYLKA